MAQISAGGRGRDTTYDLRRFTTTRGMEAAQGCSKRPEHGERLSRYAGGKDCASQFGIDEAEGFDRGMNE